MEENNDSFFDKTLLKNIDEEMSIDVNLNKNVDSLETGKIY